MKKFLISGMGRSGTKYTQQVLSRFGLNVTHEEPNHDGDGVVSWKSGITHEDIDHEVFIMQYRDPVRCIASFQTAMPNSFYKMYQNVGKPLEPISTLYDCMYCWLHWNIRLSNCQKVDYSFWVENMDTALAGILATIEMKFTVDEYENALLVPKNTHTRKGKYKHLTWDDLFKEDSILARDILYFSKSKGYENG